MNRRLFEQEMYYRENREPVHQDCIVEFDPENPYALNNCLVSHCANCGNKKQNQSYRSFHAQKYISNTDKFANQLFSKESIQNDEFFSSDSNSDIVEDEGNSIEDECINILSKGLNDNPILKNFKNVQKLLKLENDKALHRQQSINNLKPQSNENIRIMKEQKKKIKNLFSTQQPARIKIISKNPQNPEENVVQEQIVANPKDFLEQLQGIKGGGGDVDMFLQGLGFQKTSSSQSSSSNKPPKPLEKQISTNDSQKPKENQQKSIFHINEENHNNNNNNNNIQANIFSSFSGNGNNIFGRPSGNIFQKPQQKEKENDQEKDKEQDNDKKQKNNEEKQKEDLDYEEQEEEYEDEDEQQEHDKQLQDIASRLFSKPPQDLQNYEQNQEQEEQEIKNIFQQNMENMFQIPEIQKQLSHATDNTGSTCADSIQQQQQEQQNLQKQQDEVWDSKIKGGCKIIIKNLNPSMGEEGIKQILNCFGEMLQCTIKCENNNNKGQGDNNENSKGDDGSMDAYVNYSNPMSAQEAIFNLDQQVFEDRLVQVLMVN